MSMNFVLTYFSLDDISSSCRIALQPERKAEQRRWNLVYIPCPSFIDAGVIMGARVQIHLLSALP